MNDTAIYWQARADRFAHVGRGLPAVCSYGMPRLYNEAIHVCQSRALAPWINTCANAEVLDIGCGVGRWSLRLAEHGNHVTGIDISPRMVELARSRNDEFDLGCEFLVRDVVSFDLDARFDFILGVTVLQHVVDQVDLCRAIANIARHLKPNGRLVLLEVAPTQATTRCDSRTFRVRSLPLYETLLNAAGLAVTDVNGVDIAPLRPYLLPAARRLPAPLLRGLLTAVTALSLPFELFLSRRFPNACWHKVIVARRC